MLGLLVLGAVIELVMEVRGDVGIGGLVLDFGVVSQFWAGIEGGVVMLEFGAGVGLGAGDDGEELAV